MVTSAIIIIIIYTCTVRYLHQGCCIAAYYICVRHANNGQLYRIVVPIVVKCSGLLNKPHPTCNPRDFSHLLL